MEGKGSSKQWKMHLPEFEHSRRGKTDRAWDREGPNKGVPPAPASRWCLTDRQYTMRRPLFSSEHYASSLKKTQPLAHTEKVNQFDVTRKEDTSFLTRAELTLDSFSSSLSDISPPLSSRVDLGSPLAASDLRTRLSHEEQTFESPFSTCTLSPQRLSSSVLEVQRLNPPLRPPLTSTVLYPTYTPRTGHSRTGRTQLRLGRSEGAWREHKLSSSTGHFKGRTVSSYQESYWACAIPKGLPPSPDRRSADWDPNREYQDLLDYTYPLRAGRVLTEWDRSNLLEHSQTDPTLQDSGIGLDHACSTTSLSVLGLSASDAGQTRDRSTLSVGQRSPDLQAFSESSEGLPSSTDHAGLCLDSVDSKQSRVIRKDNDGHSCQHQALTSSFSSHSTSPAFTRSTSVFPMSRRVCTEVDEEFWPLPEQLEELQLLSRQVREVTTQLCQPLTSCHGSPGPDATSIPSSFTLSEKQKVEAEVEETCDTSQGNAEGKPEMCGKKTWADQSGINHKTDHTESGTSRLCSSREAETVAAQLSGLNLSSNQNNEQSDSLLQHIQVFCSHLEELIQQLYAVSERMKMLAVPTVDIHNVKTSLAEHQSFQKDLSSHQPLTSSVLHTGQLLLRCINTMSPFLRDTLLLIEKQSGALGSHTEHFYSSILSAVDSLSQSTLGQQSRVEDPGLVGVNGST